MVFYVTKDLWNNYTHQLNCTGFELYVVSEEHTEGDDRRDHYIFRFENGYGASVVKSPASYGMEKDEWELAVLRFDNFDKERSYIAYDTPITDDVIGWLNDQQVREILSKIRDLKEEYI